jgi:hypothetical protein
MHAECTRCVRASDGLCRPESLRSRGILRLHPIDGAKPAYPAASARNRASFRRCPQRFPQAYQRVAPQESFRRSAKSLARPTRTCDNDLTAADRKKRGGTRRPRGQGGCGDGAKPPGSGSTRSPKVERRNCQCSQNVGGALVGREGALAGSAGRKARRDRGGSQGQSQLGRKLREEPKGSGGVRVCQQWHDARTASEHLAPRPFSHSHRQEKKRGPKAPQPRTPPSASADANRVC